MPFFQVRPSARMPRRVLNRWAPKMKCTALVLAIGYTCFASATYVQGVGRLRDDENEIHQISVANLRGTRKKQDGRTTLLAQNDRREAPSCETIVRRDRNIVTAFN